MEDERRKTGVVNRLSLLLAAMGLLVLAACAKGPVIPTATPSPAPSATPQPSATPTETPVAVTPTITPDPLEDLVPQGTPAAQWEGIPILPGAIAGQGDDLGYVFTTTASLEEIGQFYQAELPKRGWTYLAFAEGDTGARLMIFTGKEGQLTVSVFERQGVNMVLIVK